MPVPKRYFHCAQEINYDPEMWAFTQEFGDRALRTWLQILVYLDRSQNHWRVSGDWLATLSRTVRQSSANCSRQIRWLSANGWLLVADISADGSPLVFKSPNWAKYNRSSEHKGSGLTPDQGAGSDPLLSFPTPTPSLPVPKKKNKSMPLRADSDVSLIQKAKKKTAFPETWTVELWMEELCAKSGLNTASEFTQFKNHHIAKGSLFVSWPHAFRTWADNAVKFRRTIPPFQTVPYRPTKVVL